MSSTRFDLAAACAARIRDPLGRGPLGQICVADRNAGAQHHTADVPLGSAVGIYKTGLPGQHPEGGE